MARGEGALRWLALGRRLETRWTGMRRHVPKYVTLRSRVAPAESVPEITLAPAPFPGHGTRRVHRQDRPPGGGAAAQGGRGGGVAAPGERRRGRGGGGGRSRGTRATRSPCSGSPHQELALCGITRVPPAAAVVPARSPPAAPSAGPRVGRPGSWGSPGSAGPAASPLRLGFLADRDE